MACANGGVTLIKDSLPKQLRWKKKQMYCSITIMMVSKNSTTHYRRGGNGDSISRSGVAVIYMLRFHVFKTGPTPEQEYNTEMQIAATKLEEFKSKNKEQFDENTVTLADATGIAEGKKIFTGTCFPCHGVHGEGGIGPNLTDNYWLHGGTIHDVFKTIIYGVPDKGMQAWGKTFSAAEVRDLASFVLSLQGTNPPNAKAPQGDLFVAVKATDSTAAKKDSVTNKPVK